MNGTEEALRAICPVNTVSSDLHKPALNLSQMAVYPTFGEDCLGSTAVSYHIEFSGSQGHRTLSDGRVSYG